MYSRGKKRLADAPYRENVKKPVPQEYVPPNIRHTGSSTENPGDLIKRLIAAGLIPEPKKNNLQSNDEKTEFFSGLDQSNFKKPKDKRIINALYSGKEQTEKPHFRGWFGNINDWVSCPEPMNQTITAGTLAKTSLVSCPASGEEKDVRVANVESYTTAAGYPQQVDSYCPPQPAYYDYQYFQLETHHSGPNHYYYSGR